MKLTITNKSLEQKPQSDIEKAMYFKNLTFTTIDIDESEFEKYINSGYTLTYLFKDSTFTRKEKYMKFNYVGTQYICVDIDSCEISPLQFADSVKYKPTLLHTTFSNLTPQKQNKWCFHMIYVFDDIIKGEENFNKVFQTLTEDYKELVDKNAKDCHRCIFTSNSSLDNYIFKNFNIIYNINSFNINNNIIYNNTINSSNIISDKEKNFPKIESRKLDTNFINDLNNLSRGEFIEKYRKVYNYRRETPIEYDSEKSFVDLTNIDYYEIMNKTKYDSTKKRSIKNKISIGNRCKQLFIDAVQFKAINPNMTLEELVAALIDEVYTFYDNSDGKVTNKAILDCARAVIDGEYTPIKSNKKFKVNKQYFSDNNIYCSVQQRSGKAKQDLKDEMIGEFIDLSISFEGNMTILKENGISIKKERLFQFLERFNITLKTDKELRNQRIIEIYLDNSDKSFYELETICKSEGIKVSYKTINNIVKEYKKTINNNNGKKNHLSDIKTSINIISDGEKNFPLCNNTNQNIYNYDYSQYQTRSV